MTNHGGRGGGCANWFILVLLAATAGVVSSCLGPRPARVEEGAGATDSGNTTLAARLFSEVYSITTILVKDCREAGLVFCRRIVVDFRQRGAQEIRLPYNKVMKLQRQGLSDGGYDSYFYKVSLCACQRVMGMTLICEDCLSMDE